MIDLRHVQFSISVAQIAQLPADSGAEVAFAGRSNSGKSSTLNKLTGRKALARTSKTPGRTQLLNYFNMPGDEHRLVDLPGYGFAKVNASTRRYWGDLIARYLSERMSLRGVVVVMDIRRPLTDLDRELLGWCADNKLATHSLLNKADKFGRGAAGNIKLKVEAELRKSFPNSSCQLFSASKGTGQAELIEKVSGWLLEEQAEPATAPVQSPYQTPNPADPDSKD